MPSTDIVRDIRSIVQKQILSVVSKKWLPQFKFGLQAYSLKPFQSASGNARSVVANAHTATRKCERLLANVGLGEQIGVVFDGLGFVRSGSFVNVDHSDMHGLTALVGAVQTRKGRAIPCMVETTYALHIPSDSSSTTSPKWRILRSAMNRARRVQSFTGHTIDALQDMADRLGFWPKLVFDRGFGNESIVTHLVAEGATFYVRLKAGRFVELETENGIERTEIKQLKARDSEVQLYGLTLRVIRSPKNRRAPEPWYILTNDMSSSRSKIVRIYYHRFEIEETFKDVKHIFELKRTHLMKPNSLKVLLWFVCIGIALLYQATKPTKHSIKATNPKKQTSWLRQAYEKYQQASGLLVWGDVT